MTKLSALLNLWEKLLAKQAQTTSAQSGDVEAALKEWFGGNASNIVSPLLDQAGVPGNASVDIGIVIDPHLNPSFPVETNPPSQAAHKLSGLLKQHFAAPMKKALTVARLNVTDPVQVRWLKF